MASLDGIMDHGGGLTKQTTESRYRSGLFDFEMNLYDEGATLLRVQKHVAWETGWEADLDNEV